MDYNEIGIFISQRRKEKNLTQKDLAKHLNITDKAVSKWERGLSCPDITLLTPLAEILEVSVSEILSGKQEQPPTPEIEKSIGKALDYSTESVTLKYKKIRFICFLAITLSWLIGAMVSILCDYLIFKELSWSLIVLASLVFSYPPMLPFFSDKENKVSKSLIIITIVTIPYLFILSQILDNSLVFSLGSISSMLGLILLWFSYFIFKRYRYRIFKAIGFISLAAIPVTACINLTAEKMTGKTDYGANLIINTASVLIIAIVCLAIDHWRELKN